MKLGLRRKEGEKKDIYKGERKHKDHVIKI